MLKPRLNRTLALALLGATMIATATGLATIQPPGGSGGDHHRAARGVAPAVAYSLQ